MMPGDLKEWRDKVGLSQTQLAELLGVHLMTIWKYEAGTRKMPSMLWLALWAIEHGARLPDSQSKTTQKESGPPQRRRSARWAIAEEATGPKESATRRRRG